MSPFVETNDKLIEMFINSIRSRKTSRQRLVLYENKGVIPDRLSGEIRFVSDDGSHMKLKTPSLPAFHQNVLIDIGGNLYGKEIGLEAEEAVICLTAFPDGYEEWFRNLR